MNPIEFLQYWSERPLDVDEFMKIIDNYYQFVPPPWPAQPPENGVDEKSALKDWVFERSGQIGLRPELAEGAWEHQQEPTPGTSLRYGPSYYENIGSPYEAGNSTLRNTAFTFAMGISNLYHGGLHYLHDNLIEIEQGPDPEYLTIQGTVTRIRFYEGPDNDEWNTSLRNAFKKFPYAITSNHPFAFGIDIENIWAKVDDWELLYVGPQVTALNYPDGDFK